MPDTLRAALIAAAAANATSPPIHPLGGGSGDAPNEFLLYSHSSRWRGRAPLGDRGRVPGWQDHAPPPPR
jgi:hypothetical protein